MYSNSKQISVANLCNGDFLSLQLLAIFIFFCPGMHMCAQTRNPFLTLKFDKVCMYDFEQTGQKGAFIADSNGKYVQHIVRQVQLKQKTVEKVNAKLGDKKSFGGGTAACFEPHCGFVYFSNNKVVAQIIICLECNQLRSDISIPAQKQGKQGKGNDVYYIRDGLSKSFRQFINRLLTENKFSHQVEPGSWYDK